MPLFTEISMTAVWGIGIVVFLVIEGITVGIASVWFAIGSLCSLIASACGAELWLQMVIFFAVSVLTLIFTRPIVKKHINGKVQPTNADLVIGTECRVTEEINNIAGTGAVYVRGKTWTARSLDDEIIPEGELVCAQRIEGVKLIVKKTVETVNN